MQGETEQRQVLAEYAAEGSIAPMVMLREGRFKLNVCPADPAQLFDIEEDPFETRNLADDPAHAETLEKYKALLKADEKRTGDPWIMKWDYE